MSEPSDFAVVRAWFVAIGHALACSLRWHRTVGFAKCGRTSHLLGDRPAGIDGDDIAYEGGPSGVVDGRDMTPQEVARVRRMLAQMDSDAGDALRGLSTLAVALDAPTSPRTA